MLRTRVITAIALLALLVPVVFFSSVRVWALFSLIFVAVAGHEWSRLIAPQVRSWPFAASLVLTGLVLLALRWDQPFGEFAPALLMGLASVYWLLLAPLRLKRLDARPGGRWLAFALLLACWMGLLELRALGIGPLLVAMAIVWIADIAGYFVGRAMGRVKLAPSISPGKTREGAIGGLIAVAVLGLASAQASGLEQALPALLVESLGWVAAALCLMGLAAVSIVGDLHESLLKRQAGVKDSGASLPGHGGVLDRIDALIATIPPVVLLHLLLR